jgi:hypothetical protein
MPERAYTGVTLDLDPEVHDFIATATVSGIGRAGWAGKATALGTFTLFDLASQRLSRDTTIPLQESTFKVLHVALSVAPAPGSGSAIRPGDGAGRVGAAQPRGADRVHDGCGDASIATKGREIGGNICGSGAGPGGAVSFVLAPGFTGNFSREVKVSATGRGCGPTS